MLTPKMWNSLSLRRVDALLDHKTRYQLFMLDLKITYKSYCFEFNPLTGWGAVVAGFIWLCVYNA